MNFSNKRTQQLTAQTDLCVLTLFVDDNSKQGIMTPSFARPDPVHYLRACLRKDKMHSEVSRTEVNQKGRIQEIMSPISPEELRITINN